MCWRSLRVVLDSRIEMFELVVPELSNYIPKKDDTGMSKAL